MSPSLACFALLDLAETVLTIMAIPDHRRRLESLINKRDRGRLEGVRLPQLGCPAPRLLKL